jgi:hypothetical protein
MDDKRTRPGDVDRLTSDRIAELSDDVRAGIARDLAGRKATVPDHGPRRRLVPDMPLPTRGTEAEDAEFEERAARLTAELHRTERRLDQIERSATHGRYQSGGASSASGRYARLLSRADRLDRQLRALKAGRAARA